MENEDDIISYIISSDKRLRILHILQDKKLTIHEISRKTSTSYMNAWKILKKFKEYKIVDHNNVYRNQLYFLTELGEKILLVVDKRG